MAKAGLQTIDGPICVLVFPTKNPQNFTQKVKKQLCEKNIKLVEKEPCKDKQKSSSENNENPEVSA